MDSAIWNTLEMPSVREVFLGSAASIGFGLALRIWVYLADFTTGSEGRKMVSESAILSKPGKRAVQEVQPIIRFFALKLIIPISWVFIFGGSAFFLLAAIEAIIL